MRPAAPAADTRLTYDDFVLFPDDGKRHELIDGVHYVTPSPRLRHQDLVGRLHGAIFVSLLEHPEAGRMFLAPLDVCCRTTTSSNPTCSSSHVISRAS